MLLFLLSALTLLLAFKDLVCHHFFFLSEFSTLRFHTTADLQYIEDPATEKCRSTVQAMKEMKIASYGLLVLNTESPLFMQRTKRKLEAKEMKKREAEAKKRPQKRQCELPFRLARTTTYDFARLVRSNNGLHLQSDSKPSWKRENKNDATDEDGKKRMCLKNSDMY
ncbi:hypothetical protein RB195_025432 [Necator americanus]|uniref:Uncharacterized protein n=1 Tax=Necator americanus TaxID=51031 RepID=A0ABR1ES89_NECAM